MLTYSFENRGNISLYEYLYKQIKEDIITYRLSAGDRLPSKRALAKHLDISTITVENAYNQLIAEGYIYSVAKSGYYVADISNSKQMALAHREHGCNTAADEQRPRDYVADFVSNSTANESFPFSIWAKLVRETLSEKADMLMVNSPSEGVSELRMAISDYLYQFRGMNVNPDRIVIGAGTEYLYGLIIQLLGFDKAYAVEDPGYSKISRIYEANAVSCFHISLDESGINIADLEKSEADVLHISPSHHFPTGIVTPISRRYELLSWASKSTDRYIIEDDYDSEFRLTGKPIPSLQSIDVLEKVIYINTFSKSLTSTIRISYMILPESLMERYRKNLGFYSCTVSTFEQYTLAAFIREGYFEKHINRMRNFYRSQRDLLMASIKKQPEYSRIKIREEHSGLHFLMSVATELDDESIILRAKERGINISCLSQYCYRKSGFGEHTFVINYSGISRDHMAEAVEALFACFFDKRDKA